MGVREVPLVVTRTLIGPVDYNCCRKSVDLFLTISVVELLNGEMWCTTWKFPILVLTFSHVNVLSPS